MASTNDSHLSHGTSGSPQETIEELLYSIHEAEIEKHINEHPKPTYIPSPKHEPGHNWGSENPVKSQSEGQELLDTGYPDGRQFFNVTADGVIVKFQPDNSPENGYHSYKVSTPRDIPPAILKQMLRNGKITRAEYNKFRKGKK